MRNTQSIYVLNNMSYRCYSIELFKIPFKKYERDCHWYRKRSLANAKIILAVVQVVSVAPSIAH